MSDHHLTNENLNKKFDSPFSLVNHAIKIARSRILKGETYSSNVVIDVLEDLEYDDEEIDCTGEEVIIVVEEKITE
ncbi:MAG: hypothetical protein RSB82_04255 [Victivallaceae bacterium]